MVYYINSKYFFSFYDAKTQSNLLNHKITLYTVYYINYVCDKCDPRFQDSFILLKIVKTT